MILNIYLSTSLGPFISSIVLAIIVSTVVVAISWAFHSKYAVRTYS